MDRIESFKPICGEQPVVLILGSMPSVKSLEYQEYYGFKNNQFWKIMGELFGFDRNDNYELRTQVVAKAGIAVWDVLQSCEREGSLDKDIKNELCNDIVGFIEQHPSVTHVVLNGGKARDTYKKHFASMMTHIKTVTMPSTSPANTKAYTKKFEEWKVIKQWLRPNVILTGMPGAGKSTIGVILAKSLGYGFVDTDLVIQERTKKRLQEIIDNDGMDRFLTAEEEAVLSVDSLDSVIATGGSVVYSKKAMAHLKNHGTVIYLDVDVDEIIRRVSNISTRGIAIRKGATLKDVFTERSRLYEETCDIKVDCNGKTAESVVDAIIGRLKGSR